jgi:small conductance mechanosensitive channel
MRTPVPSEGEYRSMDMSFDVKAAADTVVKLFTEFGLKIVGAIVVWIVGRMLIRMAVSLASRALETQKVDPTIVRYLGSAVSVVLTIILVVAILGFFGVETTSFAALFAAGGVAIGMAWSGLLANFAAGVFIVILRPFKVGDFISAGGVTGTVMEIGLFGTAINTPDNILTLVGNNKIFSDNIQNFSANAHRRVDLTAQLAQGTDHKAAIKLLMDKIAKLPNVLAEPAPTVEILEFTMAGPVLAVRPNCSNDHYWQVYFDTNRLIREAFGEAGFAAPAQVHVVRNA